MSGIYRCLLVSVQTVENISSDQVVEVDSLLMDLYLWSDPCAEKQTGFQVGLIALSKVFIQQLNKIYQQIILSNDKLSMFTNNKGLFQETQEL
ncbi:unnamed protein product (macronuclear) [Paramecium tetraurelia]|uniref:Uncharacterized protein n=1 Tax=Paramecium tetraurelia TaxID=5888 RepID=A0E2T9_PARTE|nr:uncharacterized protein GSPATT00022778001 [Paramecium tetraurelia]CAK89606.1 unnamed protein product [Paramecium tetraurelia]|eukprot:XP_001457003.1 hypothetical protein (macronuclear) [Paramecium tetraurelia strain d4-2]